MFRRIVALAACLAILWTGAGPAAALTITEERKLGEEAFQEVIAQIPLVEDPDSVNYIRRLGEKLASERQDSPFPFRFYIANEPTTNAFAIPGGWIFMFRGMITSMENEGELVGVMAHEMSHVYYRHLAKRFQKSGPMQAATIAGMIAGALLGALAGSPELGQAVALGSLGAGATQALAFSREDEEQADYGAVILMRKVGYPPADMARSFDRMARQQRMLMPDIPGYLLTHPTSPARMENIQNLVRRNPGPAGVYDNREFLRIRTRLIALYEPEERAEADFQRTRRDEPDSAMPLYGMALLEMRREHYDVALKYFKALLAHWPDRPSLWRDMGICHLRLGEYSQAGQYLERALAAEPHEQLALRSMAQVQMGQSNYDQAARLLQILLRDHPKDDDAQYDLGVALGRMGRTGEASLHLGLAFKQRGNFRTARYHLTRAKEELADRPDLQKQAADALKEVEDREKKRRDDLFGQADPTQGALADHPAQRLVRDHARRVFEEKR